MCGEHEGMKRLDLSVVNPMIRPTLQETAAMCCSVLEVLASVDMGEEVVWKFGVGYPTTLRSIQAALESHEEVAAVVRQLEHSPRS